jgi:hypothetical protein
LASISALGELYNDIYFSEGVSSFIYKTWKGIFILNWLFWVIVLLIKYKGAGHLETIKGLVTNILSGSLLSLIVSIPAHIYEKRTSGCFVGMWTAMSVAFGIAVALWVFGPGIIILFLEEKNKQKLKRF